MSDEDVYNEILKRARSAPWTIMLVDGEPHRLHMKDDVLRFVGNPIVRKLLDMTKGEGPPWKGYGLNEIVPEFWDDVRSLRRFYIDIGYSLSGFLELSANEDVVLALPDGGT